MYNQNVDNKDIRLEQIEGSQAGIFQTISTNNQETEFMKSEVSNMFLLTFSITLNWHINMF